MIMTRTIKDLIVVIGLGALISCSGNIEISPEPASDGGSVFKNDFWLEPQEAAFTPQSCKMVDLVIAVDDSGSMSEEMLALREEVFPAFASSLISIGEGLDDYRIAVLDACPAPASFHTRGESGECNFQSNQPWIESNSAELTGEFQCVAEIYSGDTRCTGRDDDEQPVRSVVSALSPSNLAGPNAGFLREEALLVVIVITDEDEFIPPTNTQQQLYDSLVAAKGDVRKMVFLGIGGSSQCQGVYGMAQEATALKALTEQFNATQRGVFWDLCQGQLEDGLAAAMAVIEQACNDLPLIE